MLADLLAGYLLIADLVTSLPSPAPKQLSRQLGFLFCTIRFALKPDWLVSKSHTSGEDATTTVASFFNRPLQTRKTLAPPGRSAVQEPGIKAGLPAPGPCGWNALRLTRSFKPQLPLQAGKCGRFGPPGKACVLPHSPGSCLRSPPGRQRGASPSTHFRATGKEKGRGGKIAPVATARAGQGCPYCESCCR